MKNWFFLGKKLKFKEIVFMHSIDWLHSLVLRRGFLVQCTILVYLRYIYKKSLVAFGTSQRLLVDWLSHPIGDDLCREQPVDTVDGQQKFSSMYRGLKRIYPGNLFFLFTLKNKKVGRKLANKVFFPDRVCLRL